MLWNCLPKTHFLDSFTTSYHTVAGLTALSLTKEWWHFLWCNLIRSMEVITSVARVNRLFGKFVRILRKCGSRRTKTHTYAHNLLIELANMYRTKLQSFTLLWASIRAVTHQNHKETESTGNHLNYFNQKLTKGELAITKNKTIA